MNKLLYPDNLQWKSGLYSTVMHADYFENWALEDNCIRIPQNTFIAIVSRFTNTN